MPAFNALSNLNGLAITKTSGRQPRSLHESKNAQEQDRAGVNVSSIRSTTGS
jgi:hypothetical protein